jgi:hypothetical protein
MGFLAADIYQVLPSDLAHGIDCRALPYKAGSIDCVVFEPPYAYPSYWVFSITRENLRIAELERVTGSVIFSITLLMVWTEEH